MRSSVKFLILAQCLLPLGLSAQFVVGSGTQINASTSALMTMHISSDLVNNGTNDFSGANLIVSLNGVTPQNVLGNWSVKTFKLGGPSLKSLNGNLTVTESFQFEDGILQVQNGKVLFSGPDDGIQVNEENSTAYVEGAFFQRGKGVRLFPVGKGNLYAPFKFKNVQTNEEIGVEVIDQPSNLSNDRLIGVDAAKYWEITSNDLAGIKSPVFVSSKNTSFNEEGAPVIIEGSSPGSVATSLGSASTGTLIESKQALSAPIIAIGVVKEINIKIRDLITPFGSADTNDRLFIENLNLFESNKVTLLDRWGVVIKEWTNYNNEISDYDFRKLTPGNYICIVECTDEEGTQKKSQMVTVLKTK